jgi:hypothetical protein
MNYVNEASNYRDMDLDKADRWLAKYTYESLDKYPSSDIAEELTHRYPAAPGTVIYRGMNFDTEEEWNDFIKVYRQNDGVITAGSVSSWSQDPTEAKQFAVTKPSYFVSFSTMDLYFKQKKAREYISGYRGVILQTTVKEGTGIDVNASNLGHESEIILIPGKYKTTIYKEMKRFADVMADEDETLANILDKVLTSKNSDTTDEYYEKFYKYVFHNYGDDIRQSEDLKEQIYQITVATLKSKKISDNMVISVKPAYWFRDVPNYTEVTVSFASGLFIIGENGFIPKSKLGIMQQYANKIIEAYADLVKKYSGVEYHYNFGNSDLLKKYASSRHAEMLDNIMNQQIGGSYHQVNSREEVDKINAISDPNEKRRALNDYISKITRTLSQINKE